MSLFLCSYKLNDRLLLLNPAKIKIGISIALIINYILLLLVSLILHINDVSDPLNLQIKATELSQGNFNWHTDGQEYFYFYTNVVFFTIFLSKLIQLATLLGMSVTLTIHLFWTLLLFGMSLLSVSIVWNITSNLRKTFLASLLVLVFPVMYLYPNLVVYTDTLTIFLTTLLLFLVSKTLTATSKYQIIGWNISIILIFAILFLTKANLIIFIPTLLGVVILAAVMHSKYFKKLLFVLFAIVLGTCTAVVSQAPITSHYGFDQQEKKKWVCQ